jgi:DNA-directed RNA polymerase I and III subunit RPAC2
MKYFNNFVKQNESDVSFELLNNNINISFANAIRRICLADINTPAIKEENIKITENSSYLNSGILENRISLLPLYGNTDYENITIILNKSNSSDEIMHIYSSDVSFIKNGQELDKSKYMIYNDILLTYLKKDEQFKFTSYASYSNVYNDGANFCPVSIISYSFKKDEKKIQEKLKEIEDPLEKKDFEILDASRIFSTIENEEPSVYEFCIESIGQFTPHDLLNQTFDKITEKLTNLKLYINEEKNSKISVSNADFNLESYDFNILDEDDTIGNLLSSYILDDDKIEYCGYDIPHPLDNKLIIRTALKQGNTMENNISVFKDNIDNLVKIIDEVKSEWGSIS